MIEYMSLIQFCKNMSDSTYFLLRLHVSAIIIEKGNMYGSRISSIGGAGFAYDADE